MVLDLIAQLDAEQARRIKTEHLLQQLLRAKSGRKSEQLSREQLALFAEELKAQGVDVEETAGGDDNEAKPGEGDAAVGNTQTGKPRSRRPDAAAPEARTHGA